MIVTLDKTKEGQKGKILRITGGHGVRHRLEALGVHPDDEIKIVKIAILGGPVLIEIHGSQVAIGRGMAQKIEVEIEEK